MPPAPAPLDRRQGAPPLWQQLAEDLRRRALSGGLDAWPSDAALRTQYAVSRHTVREAVRRLREEGLVATSRGRASALLPPRLETVGGGSLFTAVEEAGGDAESRLLDVSEVRDAHLAESLGLDAAAPLVRLRRLRLAAGSPLAVDEVHLPAAVAAPLLGTTDADWARTSLYAELARRCGIVVDAVEETVEAVAAGGASARLLDVAPGSPLLALHRRGASGGRTVEHRRTELRSDRMVLRLPSAPQTPVGPGGRPEGTAG